MQLLVDDDTMHTIVDVCDDVIHVDDEFVDVDTRECVLCHTALDQHPTTSVLSAAAEAERPCSALDHKQERVAVRPHLCR